MISLNDQFRSKDQIINKQVKLFIIIKEISRKNYKSKIMNGKIPFQNINIYFGILRITDVKRSNMKSNLQKEGNQVQLRWIGSQDVSLFPKCSEQVINSFQKPDILTNLQQIKYLQWFGKYGQHSLKVGRWSAIWNKEIIMESGGYYSECGQKQGLWKDLAKNYWNEAQIYEIGLYINNQRRGKWKYIYNNNEIGGGFYDEQGQKIGKWIELSDYFWKQGYVVYNGEYKNGNKYGVWNSLHKRNGSKRLKLIGCGLYGNTQEDNLIVDSYKVGKWVELNDEFWDLAQILHFGAYKEGKKVGRWDILHRIRNNKFFDIMWSSYNDRLEGQDSQNSLKNGKWIELIEGYWRDNQITYNGEYHNGVKVGKWDIYYYNEDTENNELIGGGSYIDKFNDQNVVSSVKIGNWIELSDNFESQIQVTFKGEYENGKKVGRWDIFYKKEQIGGGQYENVESDNLSESIKVGKWRELIDGFYEYGQIAYCGEYINGKKVGIWQQMFGNYILYLQRIICQGGKQLFKLNQKVIFIKI